MDVDQTRLKQSAAERAVDFVTSGMVVGLGHGTTAIFAVQRLAVLLHTGQLQAVVGVPCSAFIEAEANQLGIPLTTLAEHPIVDVTIDGADEVDPDLNLIKGGGGALLREKIVAQASRREIIVIDESKRSPALGTQWAVPVEVIPFGWQTQTHYLEQLGARVIVRRTAAGTLFTTDHGNVILDCHFGAIAEPERLAARLKHRTGVVEHGLFIGLATDLIVAGEAGLRHVQRDRSGAIIEVSL